MFVDVPLNQFLNGGCVPGIGPRVHRIFAAIDVALQALDLCLCHLQDNRRRAKTCPICDRVTTGWQFLLRRPSSTGGFELLRRLIENMRGRVIFPISQC